MASIGNYALKQPSTVYGSSNINIKAACTTWKSCSFTPMVHPATSLHERKMVIMMAIIEGKQKGEDFQLIFKYQHQLNEEYLEMVARSLDEWDITRKLVGYFSTPRLPHLMGM
ncbi:hypothetical protein AAG906_033680 [Vitis piasezkii]